MDSTISVSKGCFVFKKPNKEKNKRKSKSKKQLTTNQPEAELWHTTYIDIWNDVKSKIDDLTGSIYSKFISETVDFLTMSNITTNQYIPTACLLTGVNLPDHESLFELLATNLEKSQPPVIVATLFSEHFSSVKNAVISMVSQLLNPNDDDSDFDEEMDESLNSVVKRSECTISTLIEWYSHQPIGTRVAILVKDYEMCQQTVLQNFILLLSCYIKEIPIVLAIGIATSISNLHNSLPHHVVTKLKVKMFVSEASVVFLNNIMDQVFLKPDCSFYLGGRILEYVTEVFLYYNFSIKQFIESLKFCLMEHFYLKPLNCICVAHESAQGALFDSLDKKTLEEITKLRSTNYKYKIDNNFKETFLQLIGELKACIDDFHIGLRVLHILVVDLPHSPLGTQLREMYSTAMKKHIIDNTSFKTCLQLLKFLSKDDLLAKFDKIIQVFKNIKNNKRAKTAMKLVESYVKRLEESHLNNLVIVEDKPQEKPKDNLQAISRSQFKRKLIDNVKLEDTRPMTEFEKARSETLDHLTEVILRQFLVPPTTMPLNELLIFDDLPSIRRKIVGEDRAAQYTAFVNPQHYLDCDCCELEFTEQIFKTMPDISIVYKLHLESRFDQINIYDWLQKFISIVGPDQNDDDNDDDIDPVLQSRFVRAVNELQHLGYIRPSKYKADHVQRLTCGSC
ncbi:origin recognition complex subunit 3 [Acyrthosiphon pisum]|uniref:Origin recognition complex subunit 3 n=1 Tax=Acyrthosiphon pisum TaxID=7029 RepID=A0A8R2H9P4_ACYPI|nr:origin recognition complex subunit 3 [Acyrthosiphon pisum]XP_008188086.1 origin recognition complex subunit 3 [Acyrthosiphon pisum]XP_008188087.1 origin recognition complex subunit 3 [Acyrthosiphon pisum]XP_016663934.1 origin recognition complex subunit 3 [Acyrthosiphon pisum]|eukprot:XP_001944167.2 PREDICTED: origin recognition complex subunit 3 isoform X1 [Acyrthosiphon pisum]